MNWDELKQVWSNQPLPAWEAGNRAEIEREFAARQRRMARGLFWRDVREAGVGVLVAGFIGGVGWSKGLAGWPVVGAVLLLLAVSGFFVSERIRVRRRQPAADAPLLARLDAEIAEVRRQEWLLRRVAFWYVGPIMLSAVIFSGAVLAHAPAPNAVRWLAGAAMALILALCSWVVIALNRRGVRQVLEPRRRELEELRTILTDLS